MIWYIFLFQAFQGVPPEQAQGPDFQAAVQQGVEGQLGVPAGSVTITSVTEGDRGEIVVMYVVKNVEPADMDNMQKAMETNEMATAIGDNLKDAGFKGADVSPADAAPATVEVTQEPVIQANQPIGGASFEQAQMGDFQDAFCAAVAGQLGVDPKDVQVTDVVVDDHGAVTMSYQVVGTWVDQLVVKIFLNIIWLIDD